MFIPEQKKLVVGGYTFIGTELTSLKILYGKVTTSGRATGLRLQGGTSGYAPSGVTYNAKVIKVVCDVTTAQATILYGDTDVGINSASAPTTPKYIGGDSTPINVAAGNSQLDGTLIDFTIPTGKFVTMMATGTSVSVIVYGFES